jgi:hypothetical protein
VGADDWAQELRDYPTIWAIGTILGVTKEVDMKFTRAWDMPRFQVMVLDLIPQSVDVVIGDFIYELHFKVEEEGKHDNPVLLKMDEKDDTGEEGAGKEDLHGSSNMQVDHLGTGQRDGSSSSKANQQSGSSEHQGTKRVLFQIMAPEAADQRTRAQAMIAVYKVETTGYDAQEQVKLMAAVPEASPPSHRSKQRADNSDQANLEQVEKLKAAHNLDTSFDQGTSDQTAIPILHFTKEHIVDNLESIGISLGSGELEISKTVPKI